MRFILNVFRVAIILIFTVFCGILGVILMIPSRNTQWVINLVSRRMWSNFTLWMAGARLKVHGRENLDLNNHYIYVANHESSLDIPVILLATKIPLYFIAKKELKKVPIVGWYISAARMIFIDRGDHEKAMRSMKKAAEIIKSGKNVISFPEGTRSRTGELLMFKRGSFKIAKEGKVGVVPISIHGTKEINSPGSLKLRPGTIKVHISKPIQPEEFEQLGVDQLAFRARAVVQNNIDWLKSQ